MELGFTALLRLAWVAGTLPILFASIPSSRLGFLRTTLLGFAKRGKIMDPSTNKYTVPQRFFLHFYMVAVVWTTVLLMSSWFYGYMTVGSLVSESFHHSNVASYLMGGSHLFYIHKTPASSEQRNKVWRTVLLLLLMEAQVLRRLYETLYVFNYSPSARMHIFGYLTGLFFYTAAPLSLSCSCAQEALSYTARQVAFFIVKGQRQGEAAMFDWCGYVKPLLDLGSLPWIGMAIFLWGWVHQYRCHAILGSIRHESEQTSEYKIPHGDWFEYISCAHYFAEIVIYAGLLVAGGGFDLTLWLLYVFVVANLTFAAAETQKWYMSKFDSYPRSRWAIIPFVY